MVHSIIENAFGLFHGPRRRTMNKVRWNKVAAYMNQLIHGVMDFYKTGAIDCPETRVRMNNELADILPQVAKHFHLKQRDNKVLRARCDGNGKFVVRIEDKYLN
jgi:hypothetical protein